MYPVGDAWQGFSEGGVGGVGRLGGWEGVMGGSQLPFGRPEECCTAALFCHGRALRCPSREYKAASVVHQTAGPPMDQRFPLSPQMLHPALTNPHVRQLMWWKGRTWKWHQQTVHSLFNLCLINLSNLVEVYSQTKVHCWKSILSVYV